MPTDTDTLLSLFQFWLAMTRDAVNHAMILTLTFIATDMPNDVLIFEILNPFLFIITTNLGFVVYFIIYQPTSQNSMR